MAILGAAYLDDLLREALLSLLVEDEVSEGMFKGYAPLATFSARIDLGADLVKRFDGVAGREGQGVSPRRSCAILERIRFGGPRSPDHSMCLGFEAQDARNGTPRLARRAIIRGECGALRRSLSLPA